MPVTSSGFPAYPHFCLTWLKIGDSPWPPPQAQYFTLTAHGTQGNALLLLVHYKGCCKGYKGAAGWRGAQGETREGPGTGASFPLDLGGRLPGTWMHSPTHRFFELLCFGFLWRLHYKGMIAYITGCNSILISPFLQRSGVGLKIPSL